MSTGARYSFGFVRAALPASARRLLEVGCGDGALAAMLAQAGLEILAIDADPQAVAQAQARGVDARLAEWPDFDAGRFDALLFTRSLHHVRALEPALAAAFAALEPGGRLLVEDFALEEADEASLAWFRALAARLRAEPPAGWDVRDHDLHTARAMAAALGAEPEGCAYYFRYVESAAPAVAAAALAEEVAAVAAGTIRPLGRRWIAAGNQATLARRVGRWPTLR